jgi:hypothetical protein
VALVFRHSFKSFLDEMGTRPSRLHSLDRKNNERGYEPGNIRWATRREQNRNNRRSRMVSFRGETMCVADWADRLGMPYRLLLSRFERGWSPERALTEPVRMASSC